MSKSQSYEQLVGSYLDNEMSEKQRTDFENQLQSNPELKQEMQFQQEVINGVKNFRRLELKARLDNVPVYTPVYQTIAFKAVAVVAITAGIGFGSYYLLNRGNESAMEKVELTFNDSTQAEFEEVIPALPQANSTHDSSVTDDLVNSEASTTADIKTRKSSKKEKSTNAASTVKPNVTTPQVDIFADDEFESEEIGELKPSPTKP
ncbi:MAG: hypothetical protein U5K79_16985 [Cyclobacteriaceae bacterium]|nr:hypothetical protein [Cyclobacteriaceae bacterium]